MTPAPINSPGVQFPSALEVLIVRDFEAPIDLVFDVFWKPEHLRETFAPFDEVLTVCEVDLRVGGNYHLVMVTPDGVECSFSGTFLEVDRPHRTSQTWLFGGWPDAEAVESMDLSEAAGVTTVTYRLVFRDQSGRDRMTKYDGLEANFDNIEHYLKSLLEK